MMKKDEFPRIISYLVEKSVKGIKKQLHGYVQSLKNNMSMERDYVKHYMDEFILVMERSRKERENFAAFNMMIDEGKVQAKMMLEMREMLNIINDRMFDLEQLSIQVKQQSELQKHQLQMHELEIQSLVESKI